MVRWMLSIDIAYLKIKNMMSRLKQNRLLYFICFQLICLSGSVFYYIQYPMFGIMLWVVSCFVYWSKHKNVAEIMRENFALFSFWIIWILLCSFIIHSSPKDNEVWTVCLFPLGSMLLCSSVGFNKFRMVLYDVAKWVFGISLIVHILHSIGILGVSYMSFNNAASVAMTFYVFHTEWGTIATPFGDVYRYSSIFWEAGQCQIVLFFILLLFTDDLKNRLLDFRYLLKKYGIFFLAFLFTGSTTGYLVLMIYICILILYSRTAKKYKGLYPFFIFFAAVIVFVIYNSPVVQDKLAQSSDSSEQTSYAIRMIDNMACLKAAWENKLFGLGYNTPALYSVLSKYGSVTSANGFLRAGAAFGIYFVLFLWFVMWRMVKRMNLGVPGIMLAACLIFSQSNEYYIAFPYMFMYYFKFKDYE